MRVKDKLYSLEVRPKKERGQNFLIDTSVIDEVIRFGNPRSEEVLLEIGPGLGALTKELLNVGPLTVVEIEERFCQELRQKYRELTIIQSDIRKLDLLQCSTGTPLTVFGNLPYSFSTEILFYLIENRSLLKRAVLMLQREFAERIASRPGGKEYGIISVMVQLFCDVHLGPTISGDSFHPPTKVESQLLELVFLKDLRFPITSIEHFRNVVKGSFAQRRKKILNSLKSVGRFQPAHLEQAFAKTEIDPGRRAETLSIEEFYKLSEAVIEASRV